jgi:ribosomal protein S18 acetylase RimI-like enzyme
MPEAVYPIYMQEHSLEYAEDRRLVDYETLEEAIKTVEAKVKQLLPQGRATADHFFYCVTDIKTKETVGYVWLYFNRKERIAWLYHIVIFEKYRNQGYGRATMEQVKSISKEMGAKLLWLNVMGHNVAAQKLYQSSGLRTAAIHMNVLLSNEEIDESR